MHRPVFTIMVVLIVVILGGVSLVRLPIDLMPDITYPTLTVMCDYENASPEEVEDTITRPIERAVSSAPGVDEVTSTSSEGKSRVRVTFTWGTDLDEAANDVRDRLDRVVTLLPDEADRPTLRKFDLASFPILILGASSDMDPVEMYRVIDEEIRYRLERVPGVAAVDMWGGQQREIHVDLHADKLKALDLPLDLVVQRVTEGNVNIPAGFIDRGNKEITIRTSGLYADLDQIRDTVVAVRQGAPVHVREIAEVVDTSTRVRQISYVNGKPGLRLSVNKQSGRNTVEVAEAALKELEGINRDYPQIQIIPIIDTSDYIKRSISNVGSSALYGGLLAVFVLLLFLRNIRSTLVIATSIPVSIVATFVLMYFAGFTLNIMTLGGLALGIGMLVDNSIVVLENIFRLRESGQGPEEAAVNGAEEVSAAIVASTLTTLVVFLPLIFVRGMAGIMFKQLSVVVSFSLLCSLAVAMTLVPMLAAKLMAGRTHAQAGLAGWVFGASERLLAGLESSYKGALHFSLSHRIAVVGMATALVAGTVLLAPYVGSELMPATDEAEVRVYGEMEVGSRLDLLQQKFQHVEEIVRREVPEIKNTVSGLGGSTWHGGASHRGQLRIALVPANQRQRSSEDITNDLRNKLSQIPGFIARTRVGQGFFLLRIAMGATGDDKLVIEIRGHDFDTADALSARVKEIVEDIDGVSDVQISREAGSPEEQVVIDRQKAADMKVNVTQIANALQTAISGTESSRYRDRGNEYPILVEFAGGQKMALRDILDMTLTNTDGQPVVLRNVVTPRPRLGPVMVERKNQERVITVSGNITGRDLGSVLADVRKALAAVPVPQGFGIEFGGDYEDQQKAFRELLLSIALALVLVYMVMACQYESLRDPFVVMFSVPLAGIGVVGLLFYTHTTFNVQSYIGCIMLGGIVVNNAILLVDHTNLLRRRDGMPLRQAIEEAGRRRLRPILMTALTTILGLLPLALALGEGSEAQAPMARAVVGGLTSSTLITLVFVPVMYSLFERKMSHGGAPG